MKKILTCTLLITLSIILIATLNHLGTSPDNQSQASISILVLSLLLGLIQRLIRYLRKQFTIFNVRPRRFSPNHLLD